MDLIEQCYSYLFWGALVVLAVGILAALVKKPLRAVNIYIDYS